MRVDDLRFVGAPVDDPIATAKFIGGLILTKRQKASNLVEYLRDKGIALTPEIRKAADAYADAL